MPALQRQIPMGASDNTQSVDLGVGAGQGSASQERLMAIIASATDAIITVNDEQQITLFNAAAERMFRCPAADALGQPLDRFIPQRFKAAHREHIRIFGETGVT